MSSPNEPSDEEIRQFESDIMLVLCRRYRIKAGNGESTDYNIENSETSITQDLPISCISRRC